MFIEKVIGDLGEKRRWRQYKVRAKKLPESYRTSVDALERYLMVLGPGGSGAIFEDLIDLFEQSAADGTPVREVVGDDPVESIEAFARNYQEDSWKSRERKRLTDAIERATGEDAGTRKVGPIR
jgi:DNA-binding ferritin-like protein (Dps family)